MSGTSCEQCDNYIYDEELEEYCCAVNLDEDEYGRLMSEHRYVCPYFRFQDEYSIVRKQN